MKVVQLLTQTEGGPADHAADVAAVLARRGHDSHVVGPPSRATERVRSAGVTWHELHMTGKTDLRGGRDVVRRLRTLAPDVLHLQDRRAGALGRVLAPTLRRTGIVYTLHGVADGLSDLVAGNVRAAPRRRRDPLYYLTGERALTRFGGGRVVVPSTAVARFAVEHVRLPGAVVDVIHNGVDTDRFRPRAAGEPSDGPLRVVWLGALAPVKRLDVLLGALGRTPGAVLRVIGDGPERPAVERLVRTLGLSDRVTLVGHRDDPSDELARGQVFALTSAAENCPLALLQAMASGVPVVASRVGGVPEVVRDGVDGLLVEAGDEAALASALGRLAADRDLRSRLGDAGRRRVRDGFTLDQCVDGLLVSYARAVAERTRR